MRPLPVLRIGTCVALALLAFIAAMAAWEWHWRALGALPATRNSESLWAQQRRRIDAGEGDALVIAGSSRVLFGLQLPAWAQATGRRPIQLALEGTSAMPVVEELADDPDFVGDLVVGVTPGLFFSGRALREDAIRRYATETPTQRAGQWLSQHLIEPWWASYDADFALFTVMARQPWPQRAAVPTPLEVRKISVMDDERNTRMWSRVVDDPAYREIVRRTWLQNLGRPSQGDPEAAARRAQAQIERAVVAVGKLRARGVRVVFVRMPSSGPLLDGERRNLPRESTWDVLLARTGVPGIHFEDHAVLQGYDLPEFSHLSATEADRFTTAIAPLIEAALATQPRE